MSLKPRQASQALINPHGQTPEKVHAIMNQMLGFRGLPYLWPPDPAGRRVR
jgi:hypothetical protein